MKHLFLSLAAATAATFGLAACSLLDGSARPPAPVELAERTTIDEQALLGVELAYKAARLAAETGVDAGLIRGESAARVAAIDRQAFLALGAARQAYRAGNAADYATALTLARNAVTDLLMLAAKKGEPA